MDYTESTSVELRRARMYSRILIGIALVFLPVSIANGLRIGNWLSAISSSIFLIASLIYAGLITRLPIKPLTLALLLVMLSTNSVTIHNFGGYQSHAMTIYILSMLGTSLVMIDWRWITAATILTLIYVLALAGLELSELLPASQAMLIFRQTNGAYKIFALLVQIGIICSIGALLALMMRSVESREAALDAARQQAARQQAETEALARQIEAANMQLLAAETALRGTVHALTVTALPVRAGVIAVPLTGDFDQARADEVVARLLRDIHQQRAQTVIVDLTNVAAASATVVPMLERMIQGVRLLGAQVVLAGLQPALARQLARHRLDLGGVRSVASLAAAIDSVQEKS